MPESHSRSEPGLSVGVAWNGVGDPRSVLLGLEAVDYVSSVLLSPSSLAAEAEARKLADEFPKLQILPGGDSGIYSAWNKLISACETRHICFHGIDDFARPLDELHNHILQADEKTMIVLGTAVRGALGKVSFFRSDRETPQPGIELGRHRAPIGPNIVYPAGVLREIGGVDETFRIAGDVDLFFRARPLCLRTDIDEVFVDMMDGGMSTSAKHAALVFRENRRIARRAGQVVPRRKVWLAAAFLWGRYGCYRLFGARAADLATDVLRGLMLRPPRYSDRA